MGEGAVTTIVNKTENELLELIKTAVTTYIHTPITCTIDEIKLLSQICTNMCNAAIYDYDIWFFYFMKYVKVKDNEVTTNITKYVLNRTKTD